MNTDLAQPLSEVSRLLRSGKATAAGELLSVTLLMSEIRGEMFTTVAHLIEQYAATSNIPPAWRVAVLGDATTRSAVHALRCVLFQQQKVIEVYEAPYASYQQEILDPTSRLHHFRPDLTVLAINECEALRQLRPLCDAGEVEALIDSEARRWESLWQALHVSGAVPVIQHLYTLSDKELLGIAERRDSASEYRFVQRLNERLLALAPGFVHWMDVDRLAARVGRANWFDPRLFHHGKQPFSPKYLPDYALLLAAAVRSAMNGTKKVLVLDLDNTLWGGVIGDDGIDGIALGPASSEGEAYAVFCAYVELLHRRGVILAVCSKNDPETAREVFERHPHMPLKLADFAAFYCNWDDKASNLHAIAQELNVDISSLVFVDDNPVECELVKQRLPAVSVVNVSGDPASFYRQVDRLHYFDSSGLSTEDIRRGESYQARLAAESLKSSASDLGDFLRSLEMTAIVRPALSSDVTRLAQMESKTNQFNLTTRRLSDDVIHAMLDSPEHIVLCLFLADRFADHGLVSYIAADLYGGDVRITDWLMSCRVFSRTAEYLMFNELVRHANTRGARTITGAYIPTAKNAVIADIFQKLGFQAGGGEGGAVWTLDLQGFVPQPTFIECTSEQSTR